MCVALVTGCASTGPPAEPRAYAEPEKQVAEWPTAEVQRGLAKGLTLPVERYLQSYPDWVTVERAKVLVQRECMAGFGFTYSPPQPGKEPPMAFNAANMKRRYGITDPSTARQHGYRLPEATRKGADESHELNGPDENMVFDLTMPEGKEAPDTFRGVRIPSGGCRGESERRVGSYRKRLPEKINVRTWQDMKTRDRVTRVTRDWASCMKARGYSASTPLEALRKHSTLPANNTDMAEADVLCKKRTDLVDIYFSVEKKLQEAAVQKNLAALEELRKDNNRVVARARSILDRSRHAEDTRKGHQQ